MTIITIFKASKNKAFTILESIISLLILSFCIVSINTFLVDITYYTFNLKNTVEIFSLTRSVADCYFSCFNEQGCIQIFNKIFNLNNLESNITDSLITIHKTTEQHQSKYLQKIKVVWQNKEYIVPVVVWR